MPKNVLPTLALIFAFLLPPAGILLGIVSTILYRKEKRSTQFIMSVVSIAGGLFFLAFWGIFWSMLGYI